MSKRPRRNHTALFKAKVAVDAINGEQALAELATLHDVHANQIVDWNNQWLERAASVFGAESTPTVDWKELHAKIGQRALENEFLAGALNRSSGPFCEMGKAGSLSAKRLKRSQPHVTDHAAGRVGGNQPRQGVPPGARCVRGRSAADEAQAVSSPAIASPVGEGPWSGDQPGRQEGMAGRRVRRTAVAVPQIRKCLAPRRRLG